MIYSKSRYVQVVYNPQLNYIAFNWTDFFISLNDIKEMHHKALEFAMQNDCHYYMAETSKVKTLLSSDIIEWWGNEWVPTMANSGIKGIVTIVPTNAFAKLSTFKWQAEVVNGIMMKNVTNVEEAESAIQEFKLKQINA